jgi:thymidylate synthase (FAD)
VTNKNLIELVSNSDVLLVKHNASDVDVARAAWVSNYGGDAREKDTDRIAGLINFLYRERHMSPFEHGSLTFFIDTPIFVAREFMRHRTWSYNETSGRYKHMEPRFYLPAEDRPLVQEGKVGAYTFTPGTKEQYAIVRSSQTNVFESAWKTYVSQLQWGVAKEVARNVLPVSTMTQFYATTNPRNLIQFLLLRNDKHALKEIRDVAAEMEEQFKLVMPITYDVYKNKRNRDELVHELLSQVSEEEIREWLVNKNGTKV